IGPMGVVGYRTDWLLRRGRRAGLIFALITGLVGGVVGAAWAAARRGDDAYRRFVDHTAAPTYDAFFCALGAPMAGGVSPHCSVDYEPAAEVAFLRGLPGVEAVTETRYIPVQITVGDQTFDAAISVDYNGP